MKRLFILGVILFTGFLLRSYNLNFPSIGYHNMKENEYLSMTQEMLSTQDFVTRRIYFYNAFDANPVMKLYPQPPLVSYQTILSWSLFGENLWGARLFNVLFGVLSIAVLFFMADMLFEDRRCALMCAALLAIMPLGVFFSRNLQPESPAFFFMLLGGFGYLRFIRTQKMLPLVLAGLAFSIAWLYKFSFLLGAFPFLFCFPFRRIFSSRREALKTGVFFGLSFLLIAVAILWLMRVGQWQFEKTETFNRIRLFAVFTPQYWQRFGPMIWWYVRGENYTIIYTVLTAAGLVLAFIRRKGLLSRYLIGGFCTLILYCMIFSDHINQHNYYQMPFLAMVCVASVFALEALAGLFKKLLQRDVFVYIFAVVLVASGWLVHGSISRMHGTVFLGEDVAGESLAELTGPKERMFLLTFPQGYGIARYARRYMGWTDDLNEFKKVEDAFGIRYICFYPADIVFSLKKTNPGLFEHIQNNYHLKEAGLGEEPNKLYYIILEKGKGSNPDEFLKSFSGSMQLRTIYRVLGRYVFFYSLKVPAPESAS